MRRKKSEMEFPPLFGCNAEGETEWYIEMRIVINLSENGCHFVNLLSFASSSFFLSLRKIMWLNSQQQQTTTDVVDLNLPWFLMSPVLTTGGVGKKYYNLDILWFEIDLEKWFEDIVPFFLAHKLWDDGNGLAVLKIAGNYFLGWCSVTGARQ